MITILFDVFDVMNRSEGAIFYTCQTSGTCVLVCVHANAHIKWKRLQVII